MRRTIVDCMLANAKAQPNKIAFRYVQDLGIPPQELSNKDLWQKSAAIANFLLGVADSGSRIMLLFPPGIDYIKAFYGCLLAGMVAVPLYPPRRNVKSDRIINVAKSCQSVIALTSELEMANTQASWVKQNTTGLSLCFYSTDTIATSAHDFIPLDIDPSVPAFLQYTSGSTGIPKGVIITHENIMANVSYLSAMASGTQQDVFVNWLPLFHDLGLVTAVLWPVYLGASSTLMAPATFVGNPGAWLKTISHYRGSMCGAPNFAYDLCTDKVSDADLSSLDLSCWRVAYNAAEPVRAETLNKFLNRFSHCGFKEEAFYPGYGMAEATVFITGGNSAVKPTHISVNKKTILEHKLELVDEADLMATTLVSCGTSMLPHDVRIVDPNTGCELSDGNVGEIWFSGPSVSPGYWGLAELSGATFNQKIVGQDINANCYLKTGDLGVIWSGELFVTGRIKDLIILRGRNYYPQDLEASTAAAHAAVRQGYCAAFSVSEGNIEQLFVVAEIERKYVRTINTEEVVSAVRQRVALDHQVSVDYVVLLKPYKIPVTSSGKIQRSLTRKLFLAKELDIIAQAKSVSVNTYVAPSSEIESLLSAIWCSVLELDRIGIADNFFDLGGSSLKALEASAEVRKKFDSIDIDIEQLMEFPTIAQLARHLELKIAYAKSHKAAVAGQSRRMIIL